MRAVRRVLRDDGVVFWNLGDSYNSAASNTDQIGGRKKSLANMGRNKLTSELKPLDKCGVPERVALALQADGWYWRDTIIWAKGESFNPDRSGSVMPESQKGKRWERHRIKVKKSKHASDHNIKGGYKKMLEDASCHKGISPDWVAKWQDCPGCPKCEKTGGFILRHGNWRPTKSYEVVLMLTKTNKAWTDGEAVKENVSQLESTANRKLYKINSAPKYSTTDNAKPEFYKETRINPSYRNLRNVWSINPEPFKGAHFATFPSKLVATCVKIATCERGACPTCGKQWARVIGDKTVINIRGNSTKSGKKGFPHETGWDDEISAQVSYQTLGYMPTCSCYPTPDDWANWKEHYDAQETVPAVVFDPFMGSGTVALTARRLGRSYIGTEISEEYIEICNQRLEQEVMEI